MLGFNAAELNKKKTVGTIQDMLGNEIEEKICELPTSLAICSFRIIENYIICNANKFY